MGIADLSIQADTPQYLDCTLGRIASAHIGYFRSAINWSFVEAVRNHYRFDYYDPLVSQLARHHLRFLPVLFYAPAWRSTAPRIGATPGVYPPARPSEFAHFAALCVLRYGPGGTFWRSHASLPYYPVQAWQIWNEPNLASGWEPRPNTGAYVRLLRAASQAIRQLDPRSTVVTAGLPFYSGADAAAYVSQMYRAGARGTFDALSIHDYAATVGGAMQRLQAARVVLNRHGDRRIALWVTEWGWAGGPPNPYFADESGQRANLAAFLALVRRNRGRLGLREVMYVYWRDWVYGPGPSWWGYHLGLYTQSLHPKQSLSVFASASRQLDR